MSRGTARQNNFYLADLPAGLAVLFALSAMVSNPSHAEDAMVSNPSHARRFSGGCKP